MDDGGEDQLDQQARQAGAQRATAPEHLHLLTIREGIGSHFE